MRPTEPTRSPVLQAPAVLSPEVPLMRMLTHRASEPRTTAADQSARNGRRRWQHTLGTVVLSSILILDPAGTRAQPAPMRLSLAEAVASAHETSHRLGELEARREASEATTGIARSGYRPQITALGGYTRTNHVEEFGVPDPSGAIRVIYPDIPDNWRTRLDLQWPVYTGGRVDALVRASRAEAEASRNDLDAARVDLRLEVTRAYWGLVTAGEAVRVVEGALRRTEAQLNDARARLKTGFVPPSDVAQAEARHALQQTLLVEARTALATAAVNLRRLIGVDQDVEIEPTEPLATPQVPLGDVAELLTEARAARQDRKALEARVEAAGARTDAASAGSRPTVAVLAGFDYARPNPKIFPRQGLWYDSWDVGVSAAWTLFDGGRVRAEVAANDAARRAAEQRLADFDAALDADVRRRQLDLEAAQATLLSTGEAVGSATEAHRVLRNRYAAGVATSTEVLDAQVVQLQAELEQTRALAQVRIARAALDRVLGRP